MTYPRVSARRTRYEELQDSLTEDAGDLVQEWTSGPIAKKFFGTDTDTVDALFLMVKLADWLETAMLFQVEEARWEGHTWNDISYALGVSRQAAKKRFGKED